MRITSSSAGIQTATLNSLEGKAARATGEEGRVIVGGAPISIGLKAAVTEAGYYRFFSGWRSDPFFFDATVLFYNMQFTGDYFFADKDVCGIVLEVPNSAI